MAIVKWSEDIGTLHSVVCVLYDMLKSLNSCLICLALWKYEYGFWLFVERKRLFYLYSTYMEIVVIHLYILELRELAQILFISCDPNL